MLEGFFTIQSNPVLVEMEAQALDNAVARDVRLANAQPAPRATGGGEDAYQEDYTQRPFSPWREREKTVPAACRLLRTAWVLRRDYGFAFTGREMTGVYGQPGKRFALLACTSRSELYLTGKGGLLGELRKGVRRASASRNLVSRPPG